MDAKLVVVAGKADKQEIDLNLPMILGRQRDADLVIIHKSVSRHHCQIFEREGRLFVRDNQSSNGTFINDRQVGEAMLNPGDRLTVGPLTFVAKYNPYGGNEPLEVEDDGLDMAVSSVAIAEDEESGEDLPEARSADSGEESELDLASFGITAAEEEPSTNATETDDTFQWTESNHGVLALGESSSVDLEFDPQADAEGVASEVPLPSPHDDLPASEPGIAFWGAQHEEQPTSESLPTEAESFLPPSFDSDPSVAVNPVNTPEGEELADTLFFTPGAPRLPKGISHPPLPRKEAEADEALGAWLTPQDEAAEPAPLMPEAADEGPGLWEEPAADPYAGLPPMAGVPVAGVPMAGIPMAGIPAAVPMEVTEFADEQFPMDGSLLEEEAGAMPASSWPEAEGAPSGEAWPDLDAVPVEDLGMPAAEAADGWPTPEAPPADPFAQWEATGGEAAGGEAAAPAEPMDLTAEDLAEAAAEPQYDWSKETAEAAAEEHEPAVPGRDTMDFGAWLATSAEVPQAAIPAQPHAELSADDLVAEDDEPVAAWAGVDDSNTDLPAAITEESAMIITQQADELNVEPVAELSFDDLTEDNTSTTEPSGDLQPFFIPTADSNGQAEEPAEAFPFFTTDDPKPSDEEIDPNQFNFEKW